MEDSEPDIEIRVKKGQAPHTHTVNTMDRSTLLGFYGQMVASKCLTH